MALTAEQTQRAWELFRNNRPGKPGQMDWDRATMETAVAAIDTWITTTLATVAPTILATTGFANATPAEKAALFAAVLRVHHGV